MMNKRVYICHTYYHVYVTVLKELALPLRGERGAILLLSKMSNDFEQLKERIEKTKLFREVIEFDEKREDYFPELAQYRVEQGNVIKNMKARITFTKLYGKLEEPFIPVNLKEYQDIYVYCDSDPIGYYLNYKKIPYHAVEDGLNCIKNFDAARYDNRGHFKLKALLSSWNLIFIQNGYGKYCLDMEVNDISAIKYPCPNYKEVPRKALVDRLTKEDKELLIKIFIRDMEKIQEEMKLTQGKTKKILILTEPLCDLLTREKIIRDLLEEYGVNAKVMLKLHPRDELPYRKIFPNVPMIDGTVPMELLNFIEGIHFNQVISILTEVKAINFADECVKLGADFMDRYEDPLIHRQNEQI